ncbi:MAG TPA: hypothetical protein VHP61_03725 [Acidobacteriota bacterium]|nr:hypothetical protein [Acidobacteriota bacterium]
MRHHHVGGTRIAIAVSAAFLFVALPQAAQAKRLQVVTDQADIHLDADASSPVIETLARGAIMTLASDIKSRTNWFYVYFASGKTGNTRSGFITDDLVRKLYPELMVVLITAEDEIAWPEALDFDDAYKPILDWGAGKNAVLEAEGRPVGQQKIEGVEIVTYRRRIMGRRCLVEYVLDDGRLAATRLSLLDNFADKNRYIEDYVKLKDFAVSKMGAPVVDQIVWLDPALKSDDRLRGIALSTGQLEYQARWDVPGTEIRMKLGGGGNQVAFGAEFSGNGIKTTSF